MFSRKSLFVVADSITAVIKPPIGKLADVFGRLESFSLAIFLYTIGYIQQAASRNVQTFASAQIFWAAGFNGLQVLQQIFVADSTDLLNRALFSTLFDVPFLWTTWAGPEVGQAILRVTTWRWGYAMWAIILPACFIPLAASLFMNQRRARQMGIEVPSPFHGRTIFQNLKNLWFDLDTFGLLLFAAAISLILLPLTLAPNANNKWKNASMIAMLVIGGLCLLAFPLWERSKKLAPQAFFPPSLFKNRTIMAGTLIAFFYFSKSPRLHKVHGLIFLSGVLHVCLPLFLLLPPDRAGPIPRNRRLYYARVHIQLNYCLHRRLPDHQIHRPLQILCLLRRCNIPHGYGNNAGLPH